MVSHARALNCFATSLLVTLLVPKTAMRRAFRAGTIPSGIVRRRAMPPEPITPQLTRAVCGVLLGICSDHFQNCLRNLFHVRGRVSRIGEAGEGVGFVPASVGHVHVLVIHAFGRGVLFGFERKAGAAERAVFLEGPLGVALGSEDSP